MPPAESPVRVACIQMEPRVGERDRNIAESIARSTKPPPTAPA
jgi:hypothetical protein